MGANDVPFNGKGRPINPRFALNNGAEGVETEAFAPKRETGSVPERVRRAVPQRFSEAGDSSPAFIPNGSAPRRVSPNSIFGGDDDDDLSLDRGVNETEASPARPHGPAAPRPVPSSPVTPIGDRAGRAADRIRESFTSPAGEDDDDALSLDVGVNETAAAPVLPRVPEVPRPSFGVPKPVQPAPATGAGDAVEEAEEDSLSLDGGVNESAGGAYVAPAETGPTARVEEAPESVVEETRVAPVVPTVPTVPAPERARRVNPLFADPSTEEEEEDSLSLDVGVNETEAAPAKRVVSPLFDFKSEGVPVKRKPEVRKQRPDSMIDTGDVDDFEKEKKAARGRKKVEEPSRRPFQIQQRDITLLRFLTKYMFSYADALARLVDSTPMAITKRLRTLEEYDLVKRQTIAAGVTLWQTRKAGIELAGMNFKENKRGISFATIRHTVGLVNLAAELEREAAGSKDVLGLGDKFGEPFPAMNRFPGGIRLYGEEALYTPLTFGEMTVAEREIRQGQKRYRGGRSSSEMRDVVDFAVLNPEAPELEPGNEGLFVVYGSGGKTGEHVPDLVVTRPRDADGKPQHFAIELELTPKSPADWKRILRSYRDNGGMYSRIYYFTADKPIANMIMNADEEVGLGERLILRKYTPKNKRQPFLG